MDPKKLQIEECEPPISYLQWQSQFAVFSRRFRPQYLLKESGTQLRNIIDAEILAGQESTVGIPTEASDDYTFARRVSIDLTGRPLTVSALQAFIANPDADKREQLIDRLLASPQYARHMQYKFDVLLMQRLPKKHIAPDEFAEFLRQSFFDNKPHDQLVLEI